MRFAGAIQRGNFTEALSAASEPNFVSLAEAPEVTPLLAAELLSRRRSCERIGKALVRRSRAA
jgi:hypothetical protein